MGDNSVNLNKKELILERLNKRNKDRQNYLDAKIELRNKESTEFEGTDYFAQTFSERVKDIEKNINNVHKDTPDLTRTFASINNDIQELQRYLSNSTLFLPDYKIKACQNILNELTAQSEDVRQRLLPKKKFGFNNKKAINIKTNAVQKNSNGVDKTDFVPEKTKFSWTLSDRSNEYKLLVGTEVDRKDVTISGLKNCFVEIRGHAGSVQISNTDNCTFLCGPISRSLFAENCTNCTIVAACQQLRLHSSINCRLYLHVTCRAIIEDCTKIEVGSYNYEYLGIDIDFKKSGLDETVNNYRDVADFNWLSPDKPSPNWRLISELDYGDSKANWTEIKEQFERDKKF
ncbi:unnamed protein product [Hermetia illucens]|uniref:C-CAP/cofactor C-like domain-containing protein n=1 Tax=Hermetia illucens TaxID=343691 RepID=A0A7R8UFT0_HERIL|nr:tubulin-specific chaperone C [Hermetia illucens]CAD7080053.1 unnamed protein product [Hermetia illucens]